MSRHRSSVNLREPAHVGCRPQWMSAADRTCTKGTPVNRNSVFVRAAVFPAAFFLATTFLLIVGESPSLPYRMGYVLSSALIPYLLLSLWLHFGDERWSWMRSAIGYAGLLIVVIALQSRLH